MSKEIIFLEDRAPAAYSRYWNDFMRTTDYDTNDWTITTTEAGAGDATEAIGNLANGVLVITTDAADNDNDFLQLKVETFKFVAGYKWRFAIRAKFNAVTEIDIVMGLQITDTSPLAVTDGIYFRKDDGDALLDCVVIKDSTATTLTGVKTLVADTYYVFEIYCDGGSKIQFKVDGEGVGSAALTNVPDDEELAISFGIQNGEAVAKVMSIDYIELDASRAAV